MGSTQVSKVGSTLLAIRVEPGYQGAKVGKMVTQGQIWIDSETVALLAKWNEDHIQRQLLGVIRNTVPFREIAEQLRRQGFSCNFNQCCEHDTQANKIQFAARLQIFYCYCLSWLVHYWLIITSLLIISCCKKNVIAKRSSHIVLPLSC